MKFVKFFIISVFALSFAFCSNIDVLSCKAKIKDTIDHSTDMGRSDIVALEKMISETSLALEMFSKSEKKDFDEFLKTNVFQNPLFNITTNLSSENVWENRALENFFSKFDINFNEEVRKKIAPFLAKKEFLFLNGKKNNNIHQNGFKILNYNYLTLKNTENCPKNLIDEILSKNPDIVCFEGVFLNEDAEKLYNSLKENYAYFFMDINHSSSNLNSGLFVASKLLISEAQMHFFPELSAFDFLVMNDKEVPLGQVYLFDLQLTNKDSSDIEKFLERLDSDDVKSSIPIVVCGNAKEKDSQEIFTFTWFQESSKDITIDNEKFRLNNNDGIISLLKINENMESTYKDGLNNINGIDFRFMLCSDKKDKEGNSVHVETYGDGKVDITEDGAKYQAEAGVKVEDKYRSKNGTSVSASAAAEAKVDSDGDSEVKVKFKLSSDWK